MITWSPSAIITARACPLKWFHIYGPGLRLTSQDKRAIPLANALGIVMHVALETAYQLAMRSGMAQIHLTLPGESPVMMDRFFDQALAAMMKRWRALGLPEDDALQAELTAELGAVLESLPVPRASCVLGVEEKIEFTGESGTPFKAILDLVLRTGVDSIHIRDWKRRSIKNLPKPVELLDDVQLCQQRVAVARRWPWATTVTVGLFSTKSCVETPPIVLPLERAMHRLGGHEVTAYRTEHAEEFPAVKGSACAGCPVRKACPAFRR